MYPSASRGDVDSVSSVRQYRPVRRGRGRQRGQNMPIEDAREVGDGSAALTDAVASINIDEENTIPQDLIDPCKVFVGHLRPGVSSGGNNSCNTCHTIYFFLL